MRGFRVPKPGHSFGKWTDWGLWLGPGVGAAGTEVFCIPKGTSKGDQEDDCECHCPRAGGQRREEGTRLPSTLAWASAQLQPGAVSGAEMFPRDSSFRPSAVDSLLLLPTPTQRFSTCGLWTQSIRAPGNPRKT